MFYTFNLLSVIIFICYIDFLDRVLWDFDGVLWRLSIRWLSTRWGLLGLFVVFSFVKFYFSILKDSIISVPTIFIDFFYSYPVRLALKADDMKSNNYFASRHFFILNWIALIMKLRKKLIIFINLLYFIRLTVLLSSPGFFSFWYIS